MLPERLFGPSKIVGFEVEFIVELNFYLLQSEEVITGLDLLIKTTRRTRILQRRGTDNMRSCENCV